MKKNILYIMHSWIDFENVSRTSIGGTTLHAYDIVSNTLDKYNYFILYISEGKYILTTYIDKNVRVYNLGIKCKGYYFDNYDKEYGQMLKILIQKLYIDIIHIHHLRGHALDIYKIIKETNVSSIMTIHDYFIICAQINLLYKSDKYCTTTRSVDCKSCIKSTNNYELNITERNMVVNNLLKDLDKIIIPNESIKEEIEKTYDTFNPVVIEHGINIEKINKTKKETQKVFNVAFVGVLELLKGSDYAKKLIEITDDKNIKFHFFGTTSIKQLRISKENYIYHGEYIREELSALLNNNGIDLVCLLTKCPETFCYTLSEVICAGIPILGIDLGAIGNRIKKLVCGWTVDFNSSSKDVFDKIVYIKNNGEEYKNILNNIQNIELSTIDTMIKHTEELYELFDTKHKKYNINYKRILKKNINLCKNIQVNPKIIEINKKITNFKNGAVYFVKRPIYLIYIIFKKIVKKIVNITKDILKRIRKLKGE